MTAASPPLADDDNVAAFAAIRAVIAGGVSSTMRAAAIPTPLVVTSAAGCRVRDVEGNSLLDVNMGYGPNIFGYADEEVMKDIADQLFAGHMTGLPGAMDAAAGELIAEMVPSVEQVRFANSGTEAIASALRLARATTGRNLVVTFQGHYHGWSETILRAGKVRVGVAPQLDPTVVTPGAPGMIPEALNHTVQLAWNDAAAISAFFSERGSEVACVITEPIMANAGVLAPEPGYLALLRELTGAAGAMLIFDEVITGFRVAMAGAQGLYGVLPDLTILSKVMGGGVPVAALGGSREAMGMLGRNQALHAGVYAGNHMSVRAVVSMLTKLRRLPDTYAQLEQLGSYAQDRLEKAFADHGRQAWIQRVGSLMSVALLRLPVEPPSGLLQVISATDFEGHQALQIDAQANGLYLNPNPLEPWFLSTAHTESDIDEVADILSNGLSRLPG